MSGILAAEAGRAAPPARRPRVSAFEIRRGRTTFTYETLRYFRTRHPGAELWFLAGTDAVASLDKWRRPDEVRASCRWLVGRRPGASAPKGLDAVLLPGVFPDVSSTALRAKLVAGDDSARLLLPAARSFIRRRGLYGGKARETLRRTLAGPRFEHTLAVARLAVDLAERAGLDSESAAWAGLLHDSGRRFDPARLTRYARERRLRVPAQDQIVRHAPMLLHAFVSEDLARREFGVKDPDVLSAVRNHTFGTRGMGPLDRLLYVADISSEDRGYPEAERIRALARKDLQAAFLRAVRAKARWAAKGDGWLHPDTSALLRWAEKTA
jgi:nicotinate-nucleotide adenylyltransferase